MKRRLAILIIGQLSIGVCMGENATFIYKNGTVEFGEFRKMSADSVFMEKTGDHGGRQGVAIPKTSLAEVVFDSGDKLDMSLSEYPVAASANAANPPFALPHAYNQNDAASSASLRTDHDALPPRLMSPFVYGGFSAIVPGLGQFLQGKRAKGIACFGMVGVSVIGVLLAWNATTDAYDRLQSSKAPDGSSRDADYRNFTFRLHGSQLITGVSTVLYLLNIADATADAYVFNKHPSAVKPLVIVSSTGAGCALAVAF